jgi:hypothetical protein
MVSCDQPRRSFGRSHAITGFPASESMAMARRHSRRAGPRHVAIIARNVPVNIITNLANRFNAEELDVPSSLHTISVSIDTANRYLLRRIRRSGDMRQIITSIIAVRAAAMRHNRPSPRFQFFCGLYD